ncbi:MULTISPECIES: molybdenum cofactor biosynthesis protein MoaE [Microbacterium]|uniref:molybdenum cofactor biosynthesis protein MoaE n=1 Tax=Microbacterium TaxID=33882 RepID=UPI000493247C|nr:MULTISPECIES: molybdenum cofactor biosynthesis protein MoaE [unclassified Microbacterium]PRB58235.1 molybdenum cofactor biosynthesis protein MoaE [Microbacterium sp. MYb45]
MTVTLAAISDTALSLDAHLAAVDDARAGAVTTFLGRVRDHDPDAAGEVVALEYSSHPDAERILRDLAERAVAAGVSGEAIVAVSHRIGRLPVGSAAVVVAVAAAHRDEAFVVCREIIEAIKRELPVWKRQVEADGTTAWKGIGG